MRLLLLLRLCGSPAVVDAHALLLLFPAGQGPQALHTPAAAVPASAGALRGSGSTGCATQ